MLLFESFNEIKAICEKYGIENYTINPDGTVDIDGDFEILYFGLEKLPLNFGKVTGNFDCSMNHLTTLEGAPQSVEGNFDCSENDLTTLKGAPKSVFGNFRCTYNKLTTLEGAPQSVDGFFYCYENELTTLEGAPKLVGSDFTCSNNDLTTLKGSPQSVGGWFFCHKNNLTTLEGAPQSLGGGFYCYDNPLDYIRKLFPDDKTFYRLCMEWQFFAGGNKIWKHKFLEAMLDIGKELPESIPDYEYI